jgi:diadenosine tetraphosphate (Ap4A) HIT family hydrolase
MDKCVFCEIYKKKKGIIYENKFFYAQFDKYPVSPGHAEVIPIRHIVSLLDLNDEEWMYLKTSIFDVIKIIEATDLKRLYEEFIQNSLDEKSKQFCLKMLRHPSLGKKPDGYNIGVNEGEAAGRTINHLHLHIIPRYFGDVKNYVGGIRNVIPEMGGYKN